MAYVRSPVTISDRIEKAQKLSEARKLQALADVVSDMKVTTARVLREKNTSCIMSHTAPVLIRLLFNGAV